MFPLCKLTIALGLLMSAIYTTASEELLELACHDAQQCAQFERLGVNTSCVESTCVCSDSTTGQRTQCRPKDFKLSNIIGGPCPCAQPHALCDPKLAICYCAPDYVASADRRRCIQTIVPIGGVCEQHSQCQATDNYATCDAELKFCRCMEEFDVTDGRCTSLVGHNFCTNDTQCAFYGAGVKCSTEQNQCICVEGYVKATNATKCLVTANYKENCTEDLQCLKNLGPGGECHEGVCICEERYYPLDTHNEDGYIMQRCERIVERGQYCHVHEDCHQRNLSESEQTMDCIYGECNCKWGYNSLNNSDCTKSNAGPKLNTNGAFVALALVVVSANI